MRILVVAMADSIHTTRWISQIADRGWDLHLFPSEDNGAAHVGLRDVTVHHSVYGRRNSRTASIRLRGVPVVSPRAAWFGRRLLKSAWSNYRVAQLEWLIRRLQPDIVHSMEMQHAGYSTLAARERLGGRFPPWIVSIWGSDIYLFSRLSEHRDRVKAVLSACDYLAYECERDNQLARSLGFQGEFLPIVPMWGGLDTQRVDDFREPRPPSARRLVVLKGYQGWSGRALVGLRAIGLCTDALKGYRVAVYSASEDVRIAAELVSHDIDVPIEVIPPCRHEDMLRLHGHARVSIGLGISDGLPASMVEAMAMGAFPIQSCTSCADEWIVDGETGFIVPPEDPHEVARAIRRALVDDALVDRASELNAQVVAQRLDRSVIQPKVISMYEKVAAQGSSHTLC